jgi:alkylation response protein AidB-like acyl-CoA dehydrogenase
VSHPPLYDPRSAALRQLTTAICARSAQIEHARRLPVDLVRAMAEAGLFRLCVPRALGGREADARVLLETIEHISTADGAAGWCLMIGATTGLLAGFLPESVAAEIYGDDPLAVTGGVFAPKGVARPVDGGYRVTGQWPFASGCQHCTWLTGGCLVEGEGVPRLLYFPAADVEIIDTWTVSGLAGTGSHDIAVHDVFVPEGREVALGVSPPTAPGPLYRFPVFGLLALGVAAVGLGIARAAIDALTLLASEKTPTHSQRRLDAKSSTQAEVGRSTGALDAARASVLDIVDVTWELAAAGADVDTAHRVRLRLAATNAVRTSASVVDAMYDLAGGTAVYASSPLQRHFRDIHVVTQHVLVAPATYELAGRLLLGVPADTTML